MGCLQLMGVFPFNFIIWLWCNFKRLSWLKKQYSSHDIISSTFSKLLDCNCMCVVFDWYVYMCTKFFHKFNKWAWTPGLATTFCYSIWVATIFNFFLFLKNGGRGDQAWLAPFGRDHKDSLPLQNFYWVIPTKLGGLDRHYCTTKVQLIWIMVGSIQGPPTP